MLRSIIIGAIAGVIAYVVTGRRIDELGEYAKKKKLLGFAIAFVPASALSQFILFPLIDARSAQQEISYQNQQMVILVNTDPVLKQLAETAPDQFRAVKAELEKAAQQGKSEEEINALIGEVGYFIIQEYVASSDADLVEVTQLTFRAARVGLITNPQFCHDMIYQPEAANVYMSQLLSKDRASVNRLNSVIVNAMKANKPRKTIDWDQADDLAAKISLRIRAKHVRASNVLDKDNPSNEEKKLLCPLLEDYFGELFALPQEEAANLLRSIFYADESERPKAICSTRLCL
jgi:hypothetical protein